MINMLPATAARSVALSVDDRSAKDAPADSTVRFGTMHVIKPCAYVLFSPSGVNVAPKKIGTVSFLCLLNMSIELTGESTSSYVIPYSEDVLKSSKPPPFSPGSDVFLAQKSVVKSNAVTGRAGRLVGGASGEMAWPWESAAYQKPPSPGHRICFCEYQTPDSRPRR